jgi:L-lactate dehydrogenase complex protein LldF
MNTCPVYRRSGGHGYESSVPGPIGSILAPAGDPAKFYSLPQACSLCGSCTDVCPVKIDLHHQLLTWRGELGNKGLISWPKRLGMKFGSFVFRHPALYRTVGALARKVTPWLPRSVVYNRFNAWGRQRELPEFPAESFRRQFERRRREQ